MGEVKAIDLKRQRVRRNKNLLYDYLILAPGSHYNYFGHSEWALLAPSLKTIEDALLIRRKLLLAFEHAEMEQDPEKRRAHLTFVIVGGGPTGVELAGAIAELAHKVLASDFRHIDPASAHILLVEAAPRILLTFSENLSNQAAANLKYLGVEVKTNTLVQKIDENGVWMGGELLPSKTVMWAAGVTASSPLMESLGVPLDKTGRIGVDPDLSIPGHPNVFLIGDAALFLQDGKPLPGVAPVAMQQGKYVAEELIRKKIKAHSKQKPISKPIPFHYVDKGQLATVGRAFAIAEFGKIKMAGFIAWLAWLFVHIFYLIGFQNRVLVLIQWSWAYLTFHRGARIITEAESCSKSHPSQKNNEFLGTGRKDTEPLRTS